LIERYSIYRFYDIDQNLLRIGHTNNLYRRIGEYARSEPWWHWVTRIDVLWFAPHTQLDLVRRAEAHAIATEQPWFNRDHNGGRFRHDQYAQARLEHDRLAGLLPPSRPVGWWRAQVADLRTTTALWASTARWVARWAAYTWTVVSVAAVLLR